MPALFTCHVNDEPTASLRCDLSEFAMTPCRGFPLFSLGPWQPQSHSPSIFISVARHGTPKPGEELPPEFLGWIFVGVGSFLFLVGIAMAICILIAGRCLSRRRCYSFSLVMACIECLFVPFGTMLGVFTIIALSRESVKAFFETTPTSI